MDSKLVIPFGGSAVVRAPVPRLVRATGSMLARSGRALWRALEEQGRIRAARELARLHDGWRSSDPVRAKIVGDAHASLQSQRARDR